MTAAFDRDAWEERWARALREHGDAVAAIPPNAHLTRAVEDLRPGLALDAGCGHGSEALWLAARGWGVTAVDFSATALDRARSTAGTLGPDIAGRIDWLEADLAGWTPPPGRYDLVVCLYVHMAGTVAGTVRRLAAGVAPGGTLFLVGHRPVDPATGAATPAAGQVQVSVDEAIAALEPAGWDVVVAEDRPRAAAGTGVDAVVWARRLR
ncbi:class I SAM-dependent methyltransferase [Pseudonocardia humida]|uniref:Class I SAM-dependent methyltransferase n=1 Tax=Pseudonocardia humida TaxID=2800819 RepID=A0ABT1A0A1_9PSEU|nr:class I SAM-dependent methyltransferase [Pseudonocardia humida]MCO1656427.1 class I SAM-dependent methyltransferase [Pseudonocardia humida]